MKYKLMHKDKWVATLDIAETGALQRVNLNSINAAHLPLGAEMNNMKFFDWWKERAVPKTRDGAKVALQILGLESTQSMLLNTLALSLTDCYWVCPITLSLTWANVNLFTNAFTDIFGELTFNLAHSKDIQRTKFLFASTQGELQKKWCIDASDRRVLIKGNYGNSYQQSLNEVFASETHRLQNKMQYTNYFLTNILLQDGKTAKGCCCNNFCSNNIEFISAWEVLNTVKLKNNTNWCSLFKQICIERFGFKQSYVDFFFDYQILTDFVLSNTDRHMNNFGVLRNPDTLEYYGFAPIYDTGNSMFFRSEFPYRSSLLSLQTCSFSKWEVDLLKNVVDPKVVGIEKLPSIDFLNSIYTQDVLERHFRIAELTRLYLLKINYLYEFQNNKKIWKYRK